MQTKKSPLPLPKSGDFCCLDKPASLPSPMPTQSGNVILLVDFAQFVKRKPQAVHDANPYRSNLFICELSAEPYRRCSISSWHFEPVQPTSRHHSDHITFCPNFELVKFRRQRPDQSDRNLVGQNWITSLAAKRNYRQKIDSSAFQALGNYYNRPSFYHFWFFESAKITQQNFANFWMMH